LKAQQEQKEEELKREIEQLKKGLVSRFSIEFHSNAKQKGKSSTTSQLEDIQKAKEAVNQQLNEAQQALKQKDGAVSDLQSRLSEVEVDLSALRQENELLLGQVKSAKERLSEEEEKHNQRLVELENTIKTNAQLRCVMYLYDNQ